MRMGRLHRLNCFTFSPQVLCRYRHHGKQKQSARVDQKELSDQKLLLTAKGFLCGRYALVPLLMAFAAGSKRPVRGIHVEAMGVGGLKPWHITPDDDGLFVWSVISKLRDA